MILNEMCFPKISRALSTRIQIFLNPKLFLSGYGFPPHTSSKFGSESTTNPIMCGWVNLDIFESDDIEKNVSSLLPNNKPLW